MPRPEGGSNNYIILMQYFHSLNDFTMAIIFFMEVITLNDDCATSAMRSTCERSEN